jgi:RND superfamily putative drug exporter
MNLKRGTATLARLTARHPWTTIGIWVGVMAVAFFLISTVLSGALTTDMVITNNPESKQADTIIADKLGKNDSLNEMVIIRSATLTVDDPAFRQQVETAYADIIALGKNVVLGGVNYYMTGDSSMVSADRHATFITVIMPHGSDKQVSQIYGVTDKIAAGGTYEVFHTGDASFNQDTTKLAEGTMKTGETIGIGVALVVLAIVFGALAAAFLPVVLGVVAIIVALGLTALVGQAMDLSFTVTNMITMMGLAVGIDYSLFILTRFREERQRGREKIEAITIAGATASKAVFFSGVTVMLALAGLILFPMSIFKTMGIGAILVVLVAVIASLTLLPALLSLFGDKVNKLRLPFVPRPKIEQPGEKPTGFWARTTNIVTRTPVVSLVLTIAVLAGAAAPYFSIKSGFSGISGIPDNLPAKQGFMVLQQEFHLGMDAPAYVVVNGDVTAPAALTAIENLKTAVAADSAFTGALATPYPNKNLAVIKIGLAGDPLAKQAMDAVTRLRVEIIPQAFRGSATQVLVTGETAGILDFNQTTSRYTPIVFGFVLFLSFIVLLLAFRSIVVSATAIIMNLLSVGATYGLLVLVFQKGLGASLFGFQKVDVIESWLPLFLFAVLFGLSMDYHVFLLSRIREHHKQSGDNTAAVSFGLRSTGRLITGAALIMVAVFGGFALGDMVMFQQMGFGLAIAVLLDATLVRSVLVPATMKLLGKANWYLPKWLAWLPNIGLGEDVTGDIAPEAKKPTRPQGRLVLNPVPVKVEEIALPVTRNIESMENGEPGPHVS